MAINSFLASDVGSECYSRAPEHVRAKRWHSSGVRPCSQFCDADRNLQAAPIDSKCLGLHFAEAPHVADRHGADCAMEPPPLALDLALQRQQFVQRIRDSVMRFDSCLAGVFPFRSRLDTLDPCCSQSPATLPRLPLRAAPLPWIKSTCR